MIVYDMHLVQKSSSENLLLVAITLPPHLHLADLHLSRSGLLPRREPDVTLRPEVALRSRRSIDPWLARLSIFEPAVRATNGHVQNEIELLVERCLITASLGPDVLETGAVAVGQRESSTFPERLVEVRVEDLQETRVDVGEEVLLGPLDAKGMLGLGVGSVESGSLDVGAPPGIVGWVGTPVKGGRDDVISSLRVGVVISAGLGDINFTRQGPRSIGVVHGQHPDRGPEPITLWHLGSDFDTAVFDRCLLLGVDTCGSDWGNNRAGCDVGLSNAVLAHS